MPIGVVANLLVKEGEQNAFEQAFKQYQQTVQSSEPGNLLFA